MIRLGLHIGFIFGGGVLVRSFEHSQNIVPVWLSIRHEGNIKSFAYPPCICILWDLCKLHFEKYLHFFKNWVTTLQLARKMVNGFVKGLQLSTLLIAMLQPMGPEGRQLPRLQYMQIKLNLSTLTDADLYNGHTYILHLLHLEIRKII